MKKEVKHYKVSAKGYMGDYYFVGYATNKAAFARRNGQKLSNLKFELVRK